MAYLSTYAADKALDALFRNVPYTSTPTYVALFTTLPGMPAASGGVEVSGGSYARVRLDTLLGASAGGWTSNGSAASWAQATAAWGTVVGVGVFDAATGGNLLAAGPLAQAQAINNGDTFSLPVSDLMLAVR